MEDFQTVLCNILIQLLHNTVHVVMVRLVTVGIMLVSSLSEEIEDGFPVILEGFNNTIHVVWLSC